jgi:hypothetical protein
MKVTNTLANLVTESFTSVINFAVQAWGEIFR